MRDVNRRIVCLSDECTDILYRLGAAERVVGISAYTTRPEQAVRDKPKVSGFQDGSASKIKALNPDLVLGFSEVQAHLAAELIGEGLQVMILNHRTLSGILDAILIIARLVGLDPEGQRLAEHCARRLSAVQERYVGRADSPRVYFEEWHEPLITGITWVSELIQTAGGQDVFSELGQNPLSKDRYVTPDQVVAAQPQVVLASWCGMPFDSQAFVNRPGFSELPATRSNRIHEVDPSVFLAPGPTCILDGLPVLERLLWAHSTPTSKTT